VTSAIEKLMSLVDAPDRFNHTAAELRATQIEALNERLTKIKLMTVITSEKKASARTSVSGMPRRKVTI